MTSLVSIARDLRAALKPLRFSAPVTHVYDPLDYAREPYERYVRRYGRGRKEVVLLGMNPGPFGMAQTGVPFGDVALVRDWLGIEGRVDHPRREHPRRPVLGFACPRGEVSGRRLWGLVRRRCDTPERFFARFFVANYCPLLFLEASGRNRTPDRLPAAERAPLFAACDRALRRSVALLRPHLVIGVGSFAETRARAALGGVEVGRIPHPSPASPAANRGWDAAALRALRRLGVTLCALLVLAGPASGLRAGAAAVPIELPAGVPLAGYGARGPGNHAGGMLEPVEARALVLEDGVRIGLVVLDVLLVTPELRDAVDHEGLDGLVVAATHTHSGPGGYVDHWLSEVAALGWYRDDVLPALADAASRALAEARSRLAPARLGATIGEAPPLAINRRHPGGPTDPALPVVRIDTLEHAPLATLFAHAAHPVALPPENARLSPDYPGAARQRVEALRGGVALFLAGPLGDQNPVTSDPPPQGAYTLGARLGDRVAAIADAITPDPDAPLAFATDAFELPPVDVRIRCAGILLGPIFHRSATRLLPDRARLDALRLGPLRLLASPFELGVEVAQALHERQEAPLAVVAHAGAWLGYLLMPDDYAQGGYEACLGFHGPGMAPRFVDEALSVLRRLE